MPKTRITGVEILDGSIQRVDLDTTTTGLAVITKAVSSSDIVLSSTGVDAGTGDVTFTLTETGITAGTWTKVTFDSPRSSSCWRQPHRLRSSKRLDVLHPEPERRATDGSALGDR
jgi:hypothetical protein